MFDERHYVPIFRWKRGERGALKQLTDSDKRRLTPLIELPPSLFTLDYNAGDQDLRSMLIHAAGDVQKTGNAESWLRAGINHHMTFVVHQIASLID